MCISCLFCEQINGYGYGSHMVISPYGIFFAVLCVSRCMTYWLGDKLEFWQNAEFWGLPCDPILSSHRSGWSQITAIRCTLLFMFVILALSADMLPTCVVFIANRACINMVISSSTLRQRSSEIGKCVADAEVRRSAYLFGKWRAIVFTANVCDRH